MNSNQKLSYFLAITSVLGGAGLTSRATAQIETAGELFVDVDALAQPEGRLSSIPNNGTLGGFFEARGGGATVPFIGLAGGTKAIRFDGTDYMQLVGTLGGTVTPPPAGLVGQDRTCTIEVWALNPTIATEETMVSWGHRGGPDGTNLSFNYGNHPAFGAVGHWGSPDLGWNNAGGAPQAAHWHHLVYTYDGTTTRVYADGVLANMEVLGAGVINTYANTAINLATQLDSDGVTPTGGLRGSLAIGRVRIHDGVLSDVEILNNYNVERPEFTDPDTTAAPLSAPPTHRYSFQEPAASEANGQAIHDSIGGADGVVQGMGGQFTGSRLVLPGGSSATQAYGDLPNGLLSANSANNGGSGEISLEFWIRVNGSQNWSRMFDFGSTDAGEVTGPGGTYGGLDYLMYSAQIGGDLNQHRLEVKNEDPAGGGIVTADNNAAISSGDLHVVVTWKESTGELKAYENGVEVISTLTDDAMSDINDVNVWLGRSNYSGDSNAQAEYDEFRIYDHMLSQNEVNGNFQAGPDQLVTAEPVSITIEPPDVTVDEFGTATFSVGVSGLPPISYQWFQGDTELTGETASILTLTSVPFSDNGATFHCVVGNSVGGMDYTQTSRSAMLTVNPDMTVPTLETARTEDGSSVVVIFSEAILAADAMNLDNFSLEGPVGPVTLASGETLSAPGWVQLTPQEPLICGPYTLTVSGVHDVAANANEISPGSTATFYFLVLGGVKHLYKFDGLPNESVEGETVRDSVGSADGVIRGAGAKFSGSRVILPGGPSTSAAYIDLPNGLLSENSANNGGSGEVTIEAWVKLTGARTWSRIFDFGSSDIGGGVGGEVIGPGGGGAGLDYLFLSAQIGDDTANRRFEVRNEDPAGGGIMTQDYPTSGFGKDTHYAVTWKESTGEVDAYEDGVLKASMTVDDQISDIHDVNVWLGRSNWTADQNVQGEYDEVRIYNRALSATDVAANAMVGPENNFGPVGFLNLTVDNFSMNVGDSQPAQVMVDFENVFNVTMTGSPCLSYTTDDPGVITVDANGVLHAVGPGTATISVRFAGQEEFITVSSTVVLTLNAERIENGVRITLSGAVPGRSYTIQRAASVTGPYDMDVSTQTAPANGILVYEETAPLQESAFFHVVENPVLGSPAH